LKVLGTKGRRTRKESGCRPTRWYTLVPGTGRSAISFPQSSETRIPLEILFTGSAEGGLRRNDRGSEMRSQDGVGGALLGFITCQNADNSTVWSRMSADILSHEWLRRRAPGPAKRDSSHSYIPATTWTRTTTNHNHRLSTFGSRDRKNDKLVDLRAHTHYVFFYLK